MRDDIDIHAACRLAALAVSDLHPYRAAVIRRVTDGGSELWRLLAPGVPRGHYYPRQPRAKSDQGIVTDGRHAVRRDATPLIYEVAIPWSELKEWKPKAGQTFGFTFRVNNDKGPALQFGTEKSATKSNGLSLHPYWEGKSNCAVRWGLVE